MKYFKGKILNGIFSSNKEKFKRLISRMPDGDYLMVFVKVSDKSPSEWMKYYRVILAEVSQQVGESKEELHNMLKDELDSVIHKGQELSTKSLDTEQWQMYMDKVSEFLHKNYDFIL
jgi:glutathionylspermidine synthase